MILLNSPHTVPSLQGTLAKHTRLTLLPNFAKEPFHPSRDDTGLSDSTNLIDRQIENKNRQCLTRNIAKSGEVLNWGGFSPFRLHLGLIVNHSQSASCHIAIRWALYNTHNNEKII